MFEVIINAHQGMFSCLKEARLKRLQYFVFCISNT